MVERIAAPRLVIAGSGSGCGKTMVTAGLARCLVRRGLKVQTFKVGPDFIDPQYLTLASGRGCVNLDSWLMTEDRVLGDFVHYAQDADISLVEGVRSLYDSAEPLSLRGSTWSIASMLEAPTVLVIDVSGINMGAAAIAKGFSNLLEGAWVRGVILNKARERLHALKARVAVETMAGLQVLGTIPRLEDLKIEVKRFGLVPVVGRESTMDGIVEGWCNLIEESVDVGEILRMAQEAPALTPRRPLPAKPSRSRVKIAIALDEAFNFYYRQNLEALERLGADTVFFSPLGDPPPGDTSGLILGGGYPEVFLAGLRNRAPATRDLKKLIEDGCPTYAEGGGLVCLCKEVEDFDGKGARGLSILPARCKMGGSNRFLGYTHHRVIRENILSEPGTEIRGHEFHYSTTIVEGDVRYAYEVLRGHGIDGKHDGIVVHNALASYTHVLASGQEHLLERFVDNCLRYSKS